MTQVAQWVQDIVGQPRLSLEIGKQYVHPQDGLITITDGEYWGLYGLCNFWFWRVESTGEAHHGYGNHTGDWQQA